MDEHLRDMLLQCILPPLPPKKVAEYGGKSPEASVLLRLVSPRGVNERSEAQLTGSFAQHVISPRSFLGSMSCFPLFFSGCVILFSRAMHSTLDNSSTIPLEA